ncbi:MAG: hypothetical protein IJF07_07850 [Lachnospiraceae bacterium]|nr:hypothetical protein [Lachnospiraceae bacterium]
MSVELLQTLSMVAFIASGIFLIVSVILFFVLKIPAIIGNLSGSTARKAIEDIRQQTQADTGKGYKINSTKLSNMHNTVKISTSKLVGGGNETTVLGQGNETTLLGQSGNETTLLSQPRGNETTLLAQSGGNETTMLNMQNENQTTLLSQPDGGQTTVLPRSTSGQTAMLSPQQVFNDVIMSVASNPVPFSVDVDIYFYESMEALD